MHRIAGYWGDRRIFIGFIDIGGGLAITAGLTAGLKVPSTSDTNGEFRSFNNDSRGTDVLASGWSVSCLIIGGVILGLSGRTDLGALIAHRPGRATLHDVHIGLASTMAMYMACRALT
jgi:uncharacterized protein